MRSGAVNDLKKVRDGEDTIARSPRRPVPPAYAGTSRTLPSFQMIIGKPRRRSSARFFRVARLCACAATRTHFGISFSGIGLRPLREFLIAQPKSFSDRQ